MFRLKKTNDLTCLLRYNDTMNKRVVLLIMDGYGVGEAPDADFFGDIGANTCQHTMGENPNLFLPTLKKLGLLDIAPKNQLIEINPNKDTLSGISEMFGSILPKLDTFPTGIPIELIQKLEAAMGVKTLFGKSASGTVIMKELGLEHLHTGFPILYTSQDSVLQLLAHEEVIAPSLLYFYCQIIRDLVNPLYTIGRVIARPFIGTSPDTFQRTTRRKDFVYHSQKNPILLSLKGRGVEIFGTKIIVDIFGQDIIQLFPGKNNKELFHNLEQVFQIDTQYRHSLFIVDLEDFDMLYGHRRDPIGYGHALSEFDNFLYSFLRLIQKEDQIIITADHGNDPTFKKHTDHTRENVPLIQINSNHETLMHGTCFGFNKISEIIQQYFNA